MDELRTQPTDGQKKDLQDAIAMALYMSSGDFIIEVGPHKQDKELCFGNEPGVGSLHSNQFECLVSGNNEDTPEGGPDGDGYEEWQDVLVVTIEYQKRRKVV